MVKLFFKMFILFLLTYVCVYLCKCVCQVCAGACRGSQKMAFIPLEMLQVIVSYIRWMLEAKL